jgi:hypothetical protein
MMFERMNSGCRLLCKTPDEDGRRLNGPMLARSGWGQEERGRGGVKRQAARAEPGHGGRGWGRWQINGLNARRL